MGCWKSSFLPSCLNDGFSWQGRSPSTCSQAGQDQGCPFTSEDGLGCHTRMLEGLMAKVGWDFLSRYPSV